MGSFLLGRVIFMISIPFIDCRQYAIFVIAVLCFIVMDVATGFVQAIANDEVSSTVMRRGLWHKAGEIMAIVFSIAVNIASVFFNIGFEVPAVQAVAIYIIVMECRSIWENICKLTPEIHELFPFDDK